jgi:hypothetical protein
MVPCQAAVSVPFVAQFLDEEDEIQPNEVMEQSATALLTELLRLQAVLGPLRDEPAG